MPLRQDRETSRRCRVFAPHRRTRTERRMSYRFLVYLVALAAQWSAPGAQFNNSQDSAKWLTFGSKSGWSIKYPANLKVGSCRQCRDATAPDVFVVFTDPSTNDSMMIEPLRDKPSDLSIGDWLQDLSKTTIANASVSDQWTFIDGRPALKTVNKGANSNETSNFYLVNGPKTFAIRISNANNALFQQVLSTFRF